MKLADLTAAFLAPTREGAWTRTETLEGAQGVVFRCPQCHDHEIVVWFAAPRGAPPVDALQGPTPRWGHSGTGLADLTLTPSVHVRGCWHGWVTAGEVTSC